MTAISRSDNTIAYLSLQDCTEVISQTRLGREINYQSGKVHGVDTQLCCLVVPKKCVVIVVHPSLNAPRATKIFSVELMCLSKIQENKNNLFLSSNKYRYGGQDFFIL